MIEYTILLKYEITYILRARETSQEVCVTQNSSP